MEPNPKKDESHGGHGHGNEQLDLMMKPAAIVENAGYQEQSPGSQDAKNLTAWLAVERQDDRHHSAAVDRHTTQQRHGTLMEFARTRLVNDPEVQRKPPHRNRQAKGGGQRDHKRELSIYHNIPHILK